MPSPSDFKKAFRLSEGEEVCARGGQALGRIARCEMGHEVVQRYETYEFPTTLTLSLAPGRGGRGPSARQIEAAVRAHAGAAQLVHSAFGSPYSCSVENVKVGGMDGEEATVGLVGRAVRRRDVPTLAQRKEAERQERAGAGADREVSKQEEQRWLSGMRVIKSRWGTSKCAECGETIDPGTKIAKDSAAKQRGGWAHAACAVAARKRERDEENDVENEESGGRTKGRKKRARKEA